MKIKNVLFVAAVCVLAALTLDYLWFLRKSVGDIPAVFEKSRVK